MDFFKLDNLSVTDYTLNPNIYALQIRTECRKKYIVINYDELFNLAEWSIEEAINYYLSDEGKESRFDSLYRAYCD